MVGVVLPAGAATSEPGVAARICVLGPLVVSRDGTGVASGAPRRRRLLSVLAEAAVRDRSVDPDVLTDAVYGADGAGRRRHALATEIWRARQLVGTAAIVTDRDGYRLDGAYCDVDAVVFEQALTDGRALLRAADHPAAVTRFERALELWRGDPLPDCRDLPVAVAAAARLTELHLGGTVDLAEALAGSGRQDEAIVLLERATRTEPTREHAWALLVECHLATDRPRQARAASDTARRTLAGFGVGVGSELRAVQQRLVTPRPTAPPRPARPALVGRDAESAEIVTAAASILQRREPGLVVVTGEPGIGKTSLLEAAAAQLADSGAASTLTVRCERWLTAPFAALLPLARDLPGPDGGDTLTHLLCAPPDVDVGSGPSAADLVDAAATRLETAAALAPRVVVVDDVQWATPATLQTLVQVVARRSPVPLCFLVAARSPVQPAEDVAPWWDDLLRRAVCHLPLTGLAEVHVAALTGGSGVDPHEAHRLSRGNPLFLRELGRLGGRTTTAGGRSATLSSAISDHLGTLDRSARSVLELASVAGTRFTRPQVLAMSVTDASAPSTQQVVDALDLAVEADLVERDPDGSGLHFGHELIRDELYRRMAADRRRSAHAALASALQLGATTAPVAPDVVAHHLRQAWPVVSGRQVVDGLRAAARSAVAQSGFARAAEDYAAAIEVAEQDGQPSSVTIALLEEYASAALAAFGADPRASEEREPVAARAALERMAELAWRHTDAPARLRATTALLRTHAVSPAPPSLVDDLDGALSEVVTRGERLPPGPVVDAVHTLYAYRPPRAAALVTGLATSQPEARGALLRVAWPFEAPAGQLRIARDLAGRDDGDPALDRVRTWASEVVAGMRALDDPPPAVGGDSTAWDVVTWEIACAIAAGTFARARRLLELAEGRVGEAATATGVAARSTTLLAQRRRLAWLSGTDQLPAGQYTSRASWSRPYPVLSAWFAYAHAGAGHDEQAREAVDATLEELLAGRVAAGHLLHVGLGLASAVVRIGHPEASRALRRVLAPHRGRHGVWPFTTYWGAVDHHLGLLAAADGDLEEAELLLLDAVAAHDAVHARPWQAMSVAALGDVRRRLGHVDQTSNETPCASGSSVE